MYSKIIVGYDGSDQAKDALAFGKELADATDAELLVAGVFVIYPTRAGIDPAVHEAQAEFAKDLEQAASSVDAAAQPIVSVSPARGLHEAAEELGADLILVGSAHYGPLGQILVGSVGLALLHGAPCAVGIAPRGYRDREDSGIGTLAVAFDGSADSSLALMAASRLAQQTGAKLRLVAVAEPPVIGTGKGGSEGWHALKEAVEEQMRDALTQALATVPEGVDAEATLVGGDPVEALAAEAREARTILVLGSRGFGPLRRVLLGSVSGQLVRLAPSPLIIHPRGAHDRPHEAERAEAQAVS